ncbi:MAG: septum formation protein Maf [candidate division Zixibacteria bacterium]|nr:septum formation protein Maf [candidate division Zixibacteria bacterium]
MKIVLASSSPRRLNLLTKEGFHIEVVCPNVDESRIGDESPPEYVSRLAQKKANYAAADNLLTIGADTVVVLNDEFLNKPASVPEAKMTLEKLSGKKHTVYTGLSLICSECGRTDTGFDKTIVHFNVLTESAIIRYIETGEPMDKAGAYGIQGMGSFLVKRIEGELDTVVGFPMKLFKKMIEVHRKCLEKV